MEAKVAVDAMNKNSSRLADVTGCVVHADNGETTLKHEVAGRNLE